MYSFCRVEPLGVGLQTTTTTPSRVCGVVDDDDHEPEAASTSLHHVT
jgi:hypothetical protein